ncbi:MAG: bifunctional demethylmenaquinone methyltransferase/2-methoxy-6-polyprenyl-1,4-benzoquinol methylase UbiE [Deltaproteobacteria bacterium]
MPDTVTLFNRVAKHYDSLNTFFSLGMDRQWRKRLAEEIRGSLYVLDIATGTGEVAIETVRKLQRAKVVGIDPSGEMLDLAKQKIESGGESEKIMLVQCKAENLPFKDNVFDAVTIAFGIRNTVDPQKSLSEMKRVLKKGGKAGIMEFAIPGNKMFAPLYLFYFKNILPIVGSIFGTGKEYKYLSESTESFPQRESFTELMKDAGLEPEKSIELMMGIVIIYIGIRKE